MENNIDDNMENKVKDILHKMRICNTMGVDNEFIIDYLNDSIKDNIDIRAMTILDAIGKDIRTFSLSFEDPIFEEAQLSIQYNNAIQKHKNDLNLNNNNDLILYLKEGLSIFSKMSKKGNSEILKNITIFTAENIENAVSTWEDNDIKDKVEMLYSINAYLYLLIDVFSCLNDFFTDKKIYINYFELARCGLQTFYIKIAEIREEYEKLLENL